MKIEAFDFDDTLIYEKSIESNLIYDVLYNRCKTIMYYLK